MKKNLLVLCVCLTFSVFTTRAQFETQMPTGKAFIIQSAMNFGINNGGCWDIPGNPSKIDWGSNIAVWDLDEGTDRKFSLIQTSYPGAYEIAVGDTPNARVDIAGGRSLNGTNVWVYERNNTTAQKFRFKHLGNGRFKILEAYDKIICLESRSNANGTNVHIWENHDGPSVEWYLIDAQTKQVFIPKPISETPDFFINNKFFKYFVESMGGGRSEAKANVEKIEGNKVFVRVEGSSENYDVQPGEPTENAFNFLCEITYEDGKYSYMPDVYGPGEVTPDGQKLAFSGEAYVEFTVAKAPSNVTKAPSKLKGWIESTNKYELSQYLENVSYANLKADDEGTIAAETSKLSAVDQSTLVVEMVGNVAKNKDSQVRKHLYTELSKVTYKKTNAIIRMAINAGFNSFRDKEPVQEFKGILQDIQTKMVDAK